MNMNFEELWNLVEEDIASGQKLSEIFRENKVGMGGPEFISFEYANNQGERSKYVLNLGVSYDSFSANRANLATEFQKKGNLEEIKAAIKPKLEKEAQKYPEGKIAKHPRKNGFWEIEELLNKGITGAIDEVIASTTRKDFSKGEGINSLSTRKTKPVEGTKGLYINEDTGEYYVEGVLRNKKILSKGTYSLKGYELERTAVKPFVEKYLNLPQWRTFKIDASKIKSIKSRGETIEVAGETETINVLDIQHDNAFKALAPKSIESLTK